MLSNLDLALVAERAALVDEMWAEAKRLAGELRRMGAGEVWLFGSLAKDGVMLRVTETGTVLDSDIDLVAVMETDLPYHKRAIPLLERLDSRFSFDLAVLTPAEMAHLEWSSFTRELLRTGVKIG